MLYLRFHSTRSDPDDEVELAGREKVSAAGCA